MSADQYRICKKGESHFNLTEECFQGEDPSRGRPLTLTDSSWIQYGFENNRSEFKPTRSREGTHPRGSQWSKNPVSLCGDASEGVGGVFDEGCNTTKYPTQFPPVAPGAFGFWGIYKLGTPLAGIGRLHELSIIDRVQVPTNLGEGLFTVSFRYDCEQTSQVWNSCGDVEIVA